MDLNEYNKVKDFSYEQYCNYLKEKYGEVPVSYDKCNKEPYSRSEEGLFVHHIKENEVANLCNIEVAKENDKEFQEPENLVYCDYLEHFFLHTLIGKETALIKNLGLDGIYKHLGPSLIKFFETGERNERINKNYFEVIKNDKEVFDLLKDLYNSLVEKIDITFEHNIFLYRQVEEKLNTNNKALVVLGTGLGKTTIALQYIHNEGKGKKALVIVPNNLIKTGWEGCEEIEKVISYQAFSNGYKTEDYSKYCLVILDEAHHSGYDEKTNKGAKTWSKGIKYLIENNIKVLGLTATPERSDRIDIGKTLFKDCVCEGLAIEEAIEQKIIYPFSYVTALYDTNSILDRYKDCDNRQLVGQLDLAINNTPTMKQIFEKYMPKNKRKGIIFIQEIADKEYALNIFKDIYPNAEYRTIDSRMNPKEVEENKKWFQDTEEGYLLAINMISEGAHYKGVNTLMMFRKTNSYLVYTQQLGRIITLTTKENSNAIVFDLVNNVENVRYCDRKLKESSEKKKHSIDRILQVLKKEAEKSEQIIVADETRDIVKAIKDIKDYEGRVSFEEWEDKIIQTCYELEGSVKTAERINKEWENKLSNVRRSSHVIGGRARYLDLYYIVWTKEEIEILKTGNKKRYSSKQWKILLPRKSLTAIKRKGKELGLQLALHNNWTEAELKMLKLNYERKGPDYLEYLFKGTHNRATIMGKANELGLNFDFFSYAHLSEEEQQVIKDNYYKGGPNLCAKLLQNKYSTTAIRKVARKFGIKYKEISNEQLQLVIDNVGKLTIEELKELTNLGGYQISSIIKKYNLLTKSPRDNQWSMEEDGIIKKYYPSQNWSCLLSFIDRSKASIQSRASFLKIKVEDSTLWEEQEIKILKENYDSKSYEELAKLLPMKTISAIKLKIKKLGLKSKYALEVESKRNKAIDLIKLGLTYTQIKERLKISYSTLQGIAKDLNIPIKNGNLPVWSAEEIEILNKYYPREGVTGVSRRLKDRSGGSILEKASRLGLKRERGTRIFCIELGESFDSLRETSRNLNINRDILKKALKDPTKTAGGYHWKYIDEEENKSN